MVNIGFIRDISQLPSGFHRVSLHQGSGPDGVYGATVSSWPDDHGRQHYELMVETPSGPEVLDSWAAPMAERIQRMGWDRWCLNAASVGAVLQQHTGDALQRWGAAFWPHYGMDAVVLLEVGLDRQAVDTVLVEWERDHEGLQWDPEHDYEALERELQSKRVRKRDRIAAVWRKMRKH